MSRRRKKQKRNKVRCDNHELCLIKDCFHRFFHKGFKGCKEKCPYYGGGYKCMTEEEMNGKV